MRGDDADDLAVRGHQRAAGIAGIGRRVELDQVGQHALALGRAVLALAGRRPRRPTPTGRCRTESRRRPPRRPARDRRVERSVAGGEVVGDRLAPAAPRDRARAARRSPSASDSRPSANATSTRSAPATTCRLVRMMPLSTMTTPVPTPSTMCAFRSPARGPRPRTRTTERAPPRRPWRRATAAARSRACAAPRRRCPAA